MMDCTSRKRSVVRGDGVVVTLLTKRNHIGTVVPSSSIRDAIPGMRRPLSRFFRAVNPSHWFVRWKIEDGIRSSARVRTERDVKCSSMKYGGCRTTDDNRIG